MQRTAVGKQFVADLLIFWVLFFLFFARVQSERRAGSRVAVVGKRGDRIDDFRARVVSAVLVGWQNESTATLAPWCTFRCLGVPSGEVVLPRRRLYWLEVPE